MSRLEELIQKLCPNGVEYKEIKDIANVSIGEFVHKNKQNPNAEYPVFNGGITNTGFYDEFNRTANKIIISARGANAGFVNRVFSNFWSGNSCYTIDVTDCTIDWNFLYYWLKSKEQKLLGDQQRGGIPAVSKKQVERFITPVPPLEVQREIVRILDSFTLLTAELTAELTARKKQYEFYRDELIQELCPDGVEFHKIKDVYTRLKGTPITASKMKEIANEDGDIRIFAGGKTVIDAFEDDIPKANITRVPAVLVQSRGVIDVVYYDKPFTFKNEMWAYTADTVTEIKYLYYVLKNNINTFREVACGMGSLPQISLKVTEEFKIPVPTIEEQQRIVDILDRFDSLCNDISTGLPAEIEARQKQYEFYRDKLLSFKQL